MFDLGNLVCSFHTSTRSPGEYRYLHENGMGVFESRCEQNSLKVFDMTRFGVRPARMVDAHMGIGLAYYDLGEWDRAIEAFGRSLAQCTEDTHDNERV